MAQYSMEEAQAHLAELIAHAQAGEPVFIQDGKTNQVVQLLPIPSARKPRKAGSARGQIVMSDDFDDPLPDFDDYVP